MIRPGDPNPGRMFVLFSSYTLASRCLQFAKPSGTLLIERSSAKIMALGNFRSYQLLLEFYKLCRQFRCINPHRDQLTRASSSIALNLSEGSAKESPKERAKFYFTALGSLRECETIFRLCDVDPESELAKKCNELGATSTSSQKQPSCFQ